MARELSDPSTTDQQALLAWLTRYQRATASPGTMLAMARILMDTDVRGVLASIRVPTLVVHRTEDDYICVDHGRFLAEHIPNATYVELPGRDHSPELGDAAAIIAPIEEFVTGAPASVDPDRVLATVLFTDIAASTQRAEELGDRKWADVLARHEQIVTRQLARFGGRLVKFTGDGTLAVFDGPARAVMCGVAIRDALQSIELNVHCGIHTGEIEVLEGDIAGIAVHIAARISALASAGDVLVSRVVRDLVAGSQITFAETGVYELKGIRDEWQIFRVLNT